MIRKRRHFVILKTKKRIFGSEGIKRFLSQFDYFVKIITHNVLSVNVHAHIAMLQLESIGILLTWTDI